MYRILLYTLLLTHTTAYGVRISPGNESFHLTVALIKGTLSLINGATISVEINDSCSRPTIMSHTKLRVYQDKNESSSVDLFPKKQQFELACRSAQKKHWIELIDDRTHQTLAKSSFYYTGRDQHIFLNVRCQEPD